MNNKEKTLKKLTYELLDMHCKQCDGESYGCVGCCIESEIMDMLNKNLNNKEDIKV